MSASTERKVRKEALAAGTDRKTLLKQEEELRKKKAKTKWTVGSILAVILVVAILIAGSTIPYTATTAVTIKDAKYTPAEVNYYVGAQYANFLNTYGSYASYFGLDTQYGISGLAAQEYTEGTSWLDYFTEMALEQMTQIKALCDYAKANGISLTAEETQSVDAEFTELETSVKNYGYASADAYFTANYGTGVTAKVARTCLLDSQLASKAYTSYQESLTYTDEELEEYYQGLEGADDYFTYVYYTVPAETVTETDEEGNETSAVNEETMAAAKAKAEEILAAYNKAKTGSVEEKLNAAVASVADGETAYETTTRGGSLNSAYAEFLKGASTAGEATVVENAASTGYVVVAFESREDNHYNTKSFRHILIQAEADEEGNYTDEAMQIARDRLAEIEAEYNDGDKTEESFAELANTYSEDGGSNTNGGLYENVYKGQMVDSINSFLFEENHKPGDVKVCEGRSSGYAGYHLVYFVGEGELYSNYLARNEKTSEEMENWLQSVTEGYEANTNHFGYRYVGK